MIGHHLNVKLQNKVIQYCYLQQELGNLIKFCTGFVALSMFSTSGCLRVIFNNGIFLVDAFSRWLKSMS